MNKKTKQFLTHYLPFILLGITAIFGLYIRYVECDLPLEEWSIFPKWFPVFVVMSGISIVYALAVIVTIWLNQKRK